MIPKIIAHRGHSKKYPENTMIAFKKAVESGADGFELDSHFTTDKKIIVHHFYALGHTNNGSGNIYDKDSGYLRSLDCGSWFSSEFKYEKMPFLEEVFDVFGESTLYDVELKDFGKEYVDRILQIVRSTNLLQKIQFSSYQYPLLSYLKKQEPSAILGLIAQPIPHWMDTQTARGLVKSSLIEGIIDVIHCPIDMYDETFVDDLRTMKVQIHAGLCDTEEQLLKAKDLGADELTTNDLELAVRVLK